MKMTTSTEQGSARIYQFPVGGRAAVGGRREETVSAASIGSLGVAVVVNSGAWYHDEAIQEAERARRSVHRFPGH
jgi:hypothetical protein